MIFKNFVDRTGSDSILSDQDKTRTEKFHSPLISDVHTPLRPVTAPLCGDQKARVASAQNFTLWQKAKTEITRRAHTTIACWRRVYSNVVLYAHSVRGESHIQRNAKRIVQTLTAGWVRLVEMTESERDK